MIDRLVDDIGGGPVGVIAIATGAGPAEIGLLAVLVAAVIGVTVLLAWLAT